MSRIGFVTSQAASPEPFNLRAFRQGLRDLGYVEGQNLVIDVRSAEGRNDAYPALVADLLRLNVDLLVIGSTPAALAVKRADTSVPVVFAGLNDPVGTGIAASLARPQGNFTGVTMGVGGAGFGGKWVELLKEAVPGVAQVAVLANTSNPANAPFVQEVMAAGRVLKVRIDVQDAGNPAALEQALAAIAAGGAKGLIVTPDPFFSAQRNTLVEFAASRRLPAVYFIKLFVEAGGLMSYAADLEGSYRRLATYADKILKGAKPADLPIEQPTRFELVINSKAAGALGITIPRTLLQRADTLIE